MCFLQGSRQGSRQIVYIRHFKATLCLSIKPVEKVTEVLLRLLILFVALKSLRSFDYEVKQKEGDKQRFHGESVILVRLPSLARGTALHKPCVNCVFRAPFGLCQRSCFP